MSKHIIYHEAKQLAVITDRTDLLPEYIGSTKAECIIARDQLLIIREEQRRSVPRSVIKERSLNKTKKQELWFEYKDKFPKGPLKYRSAKNIDIIQALLKPIKNIEIKRARISKERKLINTLSNVGFTVAKRVEALNSLINLNYDLSQIKDQLIILFRDIGRSDDYYCMKFTVEGDEHYSAINEMYAISALEFLLQDAIETDSALYGSDQLSQLDFLKVENLKIETIEYDEEVKIRDQNVNFFPYYNTTNIDLTQEEIFTKEQFLNIDDHMTDNCFINVLMESGLLTLAEINSIKINHQVPTFSKKYIKQIASEHNIKFETYEVDKHNDIRQYTIPSKHDHIPDDRTIRMNIFKNHSFIRRVLPYSKFYIKNYKVLNEKYPNDDRRFLASIKNKNNYEFRGQPTNNLNIIQLMFDEGLFAQDGEILGHDNFRIETDVTILDNIKNEQGSLREQGPWDNSSANRASSVKRKSMIFYCDTETDTSNGEHIPVMTQYMSSEDTICHVSTSPDCVQDMFDYIVKICRSKMRKTKAIMYFHNMKYDFSVLKPYLENITSICRKDSAMYNVNVIYNSVNIEIRDSMKIINSSIKKMPSMFGLPAMYHKNEAIAYSYHNITRINQTCEDIECYKGYLDPNLYKEFDRIMEDNIVDCDYDEVNQTFNPYKYYKEYGMLDVLILKASMEKLNVELKNIFPNKELNIFDYLTISKIAITSVSDEISRVPEVTGNLRKYISKSVIGGRVHVNKKYEKQVIEEEISDFDACSMYPSAMIRICNEMGFPTGEWVTMNEADIRGSLREQDYNVYYVTTIKVTSINKKIQIPVVCHRTKEGCEYINELPIGFEDGLVMTVDRITLEDMVKFQHIEYEFIDGIKASLENSSRELGPVIMNLYKDRLRVKKDRPAMGELIKLILNSIYGKTCPKQTFSSEKIVNSGKLNNHIVKNFHNINTIEQINEKNHIVKSFKPDNSVCRNIIGAMILSMSKRIMNEVFNICDDNNFNVYYTDTDSMHIDKVDIPKISEIYKTKYNKDLIGNMPEQFHSDFKLLGSDDKYIDPDKVISKKSIFLGKKCYIDILEGVDNDGITCEGVHHRMKGISEKGLLNHSEIHYQNDMFKLYENLAKGNDENIILNYSEHCPSFEFTNSGVQFRVLNSFIRKVNFKS
jgi:hypothetical protein